MDFENIDQLEDYLKGVADDALELVEALKSLPPDYVKGADARQATGARSAQVDELRSRVDEHFSRMPDCLAFLVEEIQKLGQNLDTVSQNRGRLHGDKPRDEFAQAQEKLEAEHHRALKMHSVLRKLIVQLGRALQLAASRGFGGTESLPQADFSAWVAQPSSPAPTPSAPKKELDTLLSVGCQRQGTLQPDGSVKNHQR